MKIFGVPVLKFRTKNKLHISKEPGVFSWIILLLFTFLEVILINFFVPDHTLINIVCLSMCLFLGLQLIGTWEDFVIDKEENLVTLVRKNWYHDFSLKVPDENVVRFPLTSVSYISYNPNTGIEIVKDDGSRTVLPADNNNRRVMKKLQKEIIKFLHFDKLEEISKIPTYLEYCYEPLTTELYENESDGTSVTGSEMSFDFDRSLKIIL